MREGPIERRNDSAHKSSSESCAQLKPRLVSKLGYYLRCIKANTQPSWLLMTLQHSRGCKEPVKCCRQLRTDCDTKQITEGVTEEVHTFHMRINTKTSEQCASQQKRSGSETMKSCRCKGINAHCVTHLPINSATALNGHVWLVELLFRKEGLIWKTQGNKSVSLDHPSTGIESVHPNSEIRTELRRIPCSLSRDMMSCARARSCCGVWVVSAQRETRLWAWHTQTDRHTHRQTHTQTHRQTDTQTHNHRQVIQKHVQQIHRGLDLQGILFIYCLLLTLHLYQWHWKGTHVKSCNPLQSTVYPWYMHIMLKWTILHHQSLCSWGSYFSFFFN